MTSALRPPSIDLAHARAVLERGVAARAMPGAVAAVFDQSGVVASLAVGRLTYASDSPTPDLDTLYDLASLTKLFTATAILRLLERGLVCLDDPACRFLPALDQQQKRRITLRQLFTHTSGLRAWYPLYTVAREPNEAIAAIAELPLASPPASRVEYSDLGYILLGGVLEAVLETSLDQALRELVLAPLELANTGSNPGVELRALTAPTEHGNGYEARKVADLGLRFEGWVDGLIQGRVHDGNAAYCMAGLSGHAGLFASAADLVRFFRTWLGGGQPLLSERTVEIATRSWTGHLEEDRGLGWRIHHPRPNDLPHGHPRSGGDLLDRAAFGHTGFTGTSVWIDPRLGVGILLLANRVHPAVEPDGFGRVRTLFHNAAVAGLSRRQD